MHSLRENTINKKTAAPTISPLMFSKTEKI